MAKCIVCGKDVDKFYSWECCCQECYHKRFWHETLDDKAIIINGVCYHDGGFKSDHKHWKFLGHSGKVFQYRRKGTDEIITTNNLWCNGIVPDGVADNAEFV